MHIEHLALWTYELEAMRQFYETYFGGTANDKYTNPRKQFESYFLTFAKGPRLELMQMPGIAPNPNTPTSQAGGWVHVAFSVGSKEAVDALTERLRHDGYTIVGEPRTTGDGYYESVVLDPDGNRIEITE
ncbi:lactoylglutathione lyase [Catalinimonas alkaloidigena]|uniref:Lactoylglutathione lyase n=1 Tax=Catalinimonas alkaloidigena TaxID=1075417 RepID=A0A1G9EN00_9BACT|nr:VOC family protein [Catalinimonas alkaloidigena]SDK77494.1 lactoylglutathione lyase [Catalinimonas alkaloidigena]